MKKILFFFLFISIIFSSCTVVGFVMDHKANKKRPSHIDVMSSFKTKNSVLTTYGPPSLNNHIEGIDIWTYNLEEITTTVGTAQSNIFTNKIDITTSGSSYIRMVEFHFKGDEVIHYRWKNVNYSKKRALWSYVGMAMDLVIYWTFIDPLESYP